ncbi:MAG: hypothetical protein DRG82_17240 [Deltaproteobacteria bacterium]|nr:MAG: hypothetical protein DRG82_17240 [Deltaproteobacteria bacterium]
MGFVLVTMGLGVTLYGKRTALVAGVLASTALQPVVYSRAAVPDMLLSFFVAVSLYGFVRAFLGPGAPKQRRRWLYLMYAGSALAFLAKGPLGVILPGITVLAYLVLSGNTRKILSLSPVSGFLLFLLLAAPWYIYMTTLHGGAFLEEHFLQRNLQRYFTDKWQHPGPVYYFLPVVFAGSFPWSLCLCAGLVKLFRSAAWGSKNEKNFRHSGLFLLCWFIGMLLFFSFSSSKLPNYVLPLYPAAILLAARCLDELMERSSPSRLLALSWGTSLITLALLATGVSILSRKLHEPPGTILLWLSPLGVIVVGAVVFHFKRSLKLWLVICSAGMCLLLAVVTGFAIPRIESLQAVRTLSSENLDRLTPGEPLVSFRVWAPSLLFYSKTRVIRFNPDTDSWEKVAATGARWVLTRDSELELLRRISGAGFDVIHRMGGKVLVLLGEKVGGPTNNY